MQTKSEMPATSYFVKAKLFLEAIQQGVNPVTSQRLPAEDSANDAEINGAIALGIMAIECVLATVACRRN